MYIIAKEWNIAFNKCHNDEVDNNDDNEHSMEDIILCNDSMKANEEEIKEINFILDATNEDDNYKSFL